MNLCRERSIESIVDDGVFIYGGSILAGVSAKRVATKVGAIKTALFTAEEHRVSVRDKIREVNPGSILIIGTSDGMVEKIAQRLELPEIEERIYIEDITTESEREVAEKQREQFGKHIIPVPAFQLKKDFSGYFVDPLKILREWGTSRESSTEKAVVRPTYSYLGDFNISYKVIRDITKYIASQIYVIDSISRVDTETTRDGLKITVSAIMRYGYYVMDAAKELQRRVTDEVESMTAFNITSVIISIRGVRETVGPVQFVGVGTLSGGIAEVVQDQMKKSAMEDMQAETAAAGPRREETDGADD